MLCVGSKNYYEQNFIKCILLFSIDVISIGDIVKYLVIVFYIDIICILEWNIKLTLIHNLFHQ